MMIKGKTILFVITAIQIGSGFALATSYIEENFEGLILPGNQYTDSTYIADSGLEFLLQGARLVSSDDSIQGLSLGFGGDNLDERRLSVNVNEGVLRKVIFQWKSFFGSGTGADRRISVLVDDLVVGEFQLEEMGFVQTEVIELEGIEAPFVFSLLGMGARQYMVDELELYLNGNLVSQPSGIFESVDATYDFSEQAMDIEWDYSEGVDRFLLWWGEESDEIYLPADGVDPFGDISDSGQGNIAWVDGQVNAWSIKEIFPNDSVNIYLYPVNNYGEETRFQVDSMDLQRFKTPDPALYLNASIALPQAVYLAAEALTTIPVRTDDPFNIVTKVELITAAGEVLWTGTLSTPIQIALAEGHYEMFLRLYGGLEMNPILTSDTVVLEVFRYPFKGIGGLSEYLVNESSLFLGNEIEGEFYSLNELSSALLGSPRVEQLSHLISVYERLSGRRASADDITLIDLMVLNEGYKQTNITAWLDRVLLDSFIYQRDHWAIFRKGDLWDEVIQVFRDDEVDVLTWILAYYDYLSIEPSFGDEPFDDWVRALAYLLMETMNENSHFDDLIQFDQLFAVGRRSVEEFYLGDLDESFSDEDFLSAYISRVSFWKELGWTPLGGRGNNTLEGWYNSTFYGDYVMASTSFPWIWTAALGWVFVAPEAYVHGWIYSVEMGWIPYALGFHTN